MDNELNFWYFPAIANALKSTESDMALQLRRLKCEADDLKQ